MKRKQFYAHGLAFPYLSYTEEVIVQMIKTAKSLGYSGLTLVAVLIDKSVTPTDLVRIFHKLDMKCIICGFNAGNGPDPLSDEGIEAAAANLETQAQYAKAIADAKLGPPIMVGPMHCWHKAMRAELEDRAFERWLSRVAEIGKKFQLKMCLEALNRFEDGTPAPFQTLLYYIALQPKDLALHLDTGHAHARKLDAQFFKKHAHLIGFIEFANVMRLPCAVHKGIDFREFGELAAMVDCERGVEPFNTLIVTTFELTHICSTEHDGVATLERDAEFFHSIGLMELAIVAA